MRECVESSRVEQLKALRLIIADEIDQKPGARDLAGLSKQYREIIKEIEEIEGTDNGEDEIAKLISESDGLSRAVRPDRSKV